jgi:hypothetical protein
MRRCCLIPCLLLAAMAAFAAPSDASPLAEMDSYMAKARDAIDSNHLAEAIRSYIAVLSLAEGNPSAEAAKKSAAAEAELGRVATRLSLEPAGSWLDAKGTQIEGDSRGIGKPGALQPAVYLFENFGTGKAPVGDAPIFFEFTKNSGSIISFVTTDAYGKANTTIASLEAPGKEAVVRAYPLFKSRGKSFAFKSVFRDFAYLPPTKALKLAALDSSELGEGADPGMIDAAAAALRDSGFSIIPSGATPEPSGFRAAYAGDSSALAALGLSAEAPYAALVLVEAGAAKQTELNGKKYNIFTAVASASFRLIGSSGGIVYALALDGIKGQGATREAAVADAYKRARASFGPELRKRLPELEAALTKY